LVRTLRPCDWVAALYFAYTSVLALVLPVSREVTLRTLAVNLVVFAFLLARPWCRRPWQSVMHTYLMLALLVTGYQEMGWFAQPHTGTALEETWVVWDRYVLDRLGLRALIEALGPILPVVLEIAYTTVYVTGVTSLTLLYVFGRGSRAHVLLFCLLLGTFASYAMFPFFPSEPPRTVFPHQDLPNYRPFFRSFNYWILGNWGIHTSVFPSAHVSAAFSAAFGLRLLLPDRKWAWRAMGVLAMLIALSTVYGRYHYLVDAVAGFGVALAARFLTFRFAKR
jgi:membrane-associated phospholipid phosphatase